MSTRKSFSEWIRSGLPERPLSIAVLVFVCVLIAKSFAERLIPDEPRNTVVGLGIFVLLIVLYKTTKKHIMGDRMLG